MQNLSSILLDTEVTLSLLTNRGLPRNFFYGNMCCQRQSVHWLIATADLNVQESLCNKPFIIYKPSKLHIQITWGILLMPQRSRQLEGGVAFVISLCLEWTSAEPPWVSGPEQCVAKLFFSLWLYTFYSGLQKIQYWEFKVVPVFCTSGKLASGGGLSKSEGRWDRGKKNPQRFLTQFSSSPFLLFLWFLSSAGSRNGEAFPQGPPPPCSLPRPAQQEKCLWCQARK